MLIRSASTVLFHFYITYTDFSQKLNSLYANARDRGGAEHVAESVAADQHLGHCLVDMLLSDGVECGHGGILKSKVDQLVGMDDDALAQWIVETRFRVSVADFREFLAGVTCNDATRKITCANGVHDGICTSGPVYITLRPNSAPYVNLGPWYKHLRNLFPVQALVPASVKQKRPASTAISNTEREFDSPARPAKKQTGPAK